MHLRDVERFFHGHHLTINLRNEDEIDMTDILKKVSEATASAFNFKEKPQGMEHSPQPVGTAHKKINPLAELPAAAEREQFWSRDQEEEKRRVLAERERRSQEQRRAEEERRQREEAEGRLRESQIKERERKISSLRQMEESEQADKVSMEKSRWQMQQVKIKN
jgi:drebrin-like protein